MMKKLSKEHQKFVDECAMRAMQGMIPREWWEKPFSRKYGDREALEFCVKFSSDVAYAMLEEKLKREKLDD